MPSEFVPFLKSTGNSGATVAVHPTPSQATDNASSSATFAALVSNKTTSGHLPTSTLCANSPAKSKPVVTLKRNGDQVTHIHIQCGCGEVVELECAY